MNWPSIVQLIPVLQTAVGPAILISGVGLLLLTMTNRLGRAIDRARNLRGQVVIASESGRVKIAAQLEILWRRAQLIRVAITLAALSALLAGVLIIAVFFTALWRLETPWLICGLFVTCLLCLLASLCVFLVDINQSLAALRLELGLDRDEA